MKYFIANLKMNLLNEREVDRYFHDFGKYLKKVDLTGKIVVACPPFVWLEYMEDFESVFQKVKLGAQNVFWKYRGAYTGEISPKMLKNLGVQYVIIGHSERRRWLNETDEMIGKKVKAALDLGLKVVLAVGEFKKNEPKSLIINQTKKALSDVSRNRIKNLLIAYEPVWAIGTGLSDTPQNAARSAEIIRQVVAQKFGKPIAKKLPILYGGSVTSKNAAKFINYEGIDGVLVGGASLKPKEFLKIINFKK